MSRILLVSANLCEDPFPVYPLGMGVVAAGLEARGHEVHQFDLLAAGGSESALAECIRGWRPEFVGISIRNFDTCDSLCDSDHAAGTRRIVEVIRAESRAPVLLGGAGFSVLPEAFLAFTGADHGIVGEGEVLAADLIEALAAGRPAPRILRSEGLLPPEAIGGPCFDPALVDHYLAQSGLLNLQTRRGCPFRCIYCNYPALEGSRYRFRDPRQVVEELAEAQRRFGVERFFFADSVFNEPGGHHLRIAEAILARGLQVAWTCYLRPQGLSRGEIALLKRAGLRAAELGTDAASDAALAGLRKGFTFEEVVEANEAFVAEEVPCAHFVMFGGPGETRETVREGLENLERLRCTVVFAFSGLRIFPGAPLREVALRDGVLAEDADLRTPTFYHAPGLDAGWLNATLEAAFRGRRDRFFPPERARERQETLRRMGFRGQLWDTMIRFPQSQPPERIPC